MHTPDPTDAILPTDLLPTREGYDRWAEVYDSDDNPLVALEEPHVTQLLGDVRGLPIADVGCGTGRHALALAAAGANVTAIDFSDEMLNKARAKPGAANIRFLQHDLTQSLPFDDGAFDRVLCALVLDHVPDLLPLFREMKRICRRSGAIVVSVVHPAMELRGVRARFIDPATGRRTYPQSCSHPIADYVNAVVGAGLHIDHISEHVVDDALATRSPRARRYLGWPILLLLRLTQRNP